MLLAPNTFRCQFTFAATVTNTTQIKILSVSGAWNRRSSARNSRSPPEFACLGTAAISAPPAPELIAISPSEAVRSNDSAFEDLQMRPIILDLLFQGC